MSFSDADMYNQQLRQGLQQAVINEVKRVPVIAGFSAIGPYLQLMRRDTNEPVKDIFSLNVVTGEAMFPVRNQAGGFVQDEENGGIAMTRIVLDLRLYFFQFKHHQL